MSKVKFELNKAGVRELLRSDEMMSICEEYARHVQRRVGDDYSVHRGPNRVNVSVETKKALADNYRNNTLLKAVRGK